MSPKGNEPEWYGVKGLFRWYFKESGETASIEERVVLFKADSFDDAIAKAEAEAVDYCVDDASANYKIESMEWWNAFVIGNEMLDSGTEVFSRLVDSSLSSSSFLKRYYPKSHDSGK